MKLVTDRMLSEVTTCLQLTLDIFKVPLHPGHQSHGLESHDSEPMLKRHTVRLGYCSQHCALVLFANLFAPCHWQTLRCLQLRLRLNFNYDRNEVESLDVVHIEMPARICLALCVTLPSLG